MIDQTLTTPPDAPSSNDIPTFRTRFDAFIAWIVTFVSQLTTVISQINSTASTINSKESSATSAASTATTKAGIATTKASEASTSATAAYNAQLAAEAVFDNFDDKYLGAKATAPTVDNDGNHLVTGALFFKTTSPKGIYVYDAELSIWSSPTYVPTSHGSLSGRSDTDSHPMSAITGLIEALLAKAPLLSPALTGTPTAPTQAGTDNSTKIATTAFVKALLAAASDTAQGLIEIATNAEVQAGTDTTRAVTPAGLMSAFAQSKSQSGYIKLPGGVIIQWGKTGSVSASATVTVTFPLAFTITTPVVTCNSDYSSTNNNYQAKPEDTTATTVTIRNGNGAADSIHWHAIGY